MPRLQGHIANNANLDNYSDYIDSLRLDNVLDTLESNEREPLLLDGAVLVSLYHVRVLVESQAVVVLDGGELLVGELDLNVGEEIHLVLFEHRAELGSCLGPEEGCLDQDLILVDELKVHEGALTLLIAPLTRLVLLGHSCPDFPICRKLIQDPDRSVHVLNRGHASPRLVKVACIAIARGLLLAMRLLHLKRLLPCSTTICLRVRRHLPLLLFIWLLPSIWVIDG